MHISVFSLTQTYQLICYILSTTVCTMVYVFKESATNALFEKPGKCTDSCSDDWMYLESPHYNHISLHLLFSRIGHHFVFCLHFPQSF